MLGIIENYAKMLNLQKGKKLKKDFIPSQIYIKEYATGG